MPNSNSDTDNNKSKEDIISYSQTSNDKIEDKEFVAEKIGLEIQN